MSRAIGARVLGVLLLASSLAGCSDGDEGDAREPVPGPGTTGPPATTPPATGLPAAVPEELPTSSEAPPDVPPEPMPAPPPPPPPTITVSGRVAVLDQVSFEGSIDGDPDYPVVAGMPCAGDEGYGDIAPGGPVIVTDGAGLALATTQLVGGSTVTGVRGTDSERIARERLVNSIFDLRAARSARSPLRLAELNLARAEQRLADIDSPLRWPPFEGHALEAQWCEVEFSVPGLPVLDTYGIAVTHRGTTMVSRTEVESDQVALTIG